MLLPLFIAHRNNCLLAGTRPPPDPSSLAGSNGGGHGRAEADTDSVIRGLCLAGSVSPESGVSVLTFEQTEDCGVSDFTLVYKEDCGVRDFTLEYTEEGEEDDLSRERGGGCGVRDRALEYTGDGGGSASSPVDGTVRGDRG